MYSSGLSISCHILRLTMCNVSVREEIQVCNNVWTSIKKCLQLLPDRIWGYGRISILYLELLQLSTVLMGGNEHNRLLSTKSVTIYFGQPYWNKKDLFIFLSLFAIVDGDNIYYIKAKHTLVRYFLTWSTLYIFDVNYRWQ